MRKTSELTLRLLLAGALAAVGAAAGPSWTNPVWPGSFPDPTTWRLPDGTWRATSTSMKILRSDDFIHWSDTGKRIFARNEERRIRKTHPHIWAPDSFKIGDEYLMYVSLVGGKEGDKIAVYSSKSPEGPFTDGHIVTAKIDTGIDSIDPEVVRDDRDGALWLFYGSTSGIHRVRLSPDGKSIPAGARHERVAGLAYNDDKSRQKVFEGAYLHRREGWWYLFASKAWYANHTYAAVVGRARTLDGPFLDRKGRRMLDGFATPVIASRKGDRFFGPGHNGEITTVNGRDYIPYHCHVDGETPKARPLFISELVWDGDGWPKVALLEKP